ncbi:energy transducer TonB [Aliidiomarina sedimenti]|nr:energy transducer TonB [Aliidiomarina sedimenti]
MFIVLLLSGCSSVSEEEKVLSMEDKLEMFEDNSVKRPSRCVSHSSVLQSGKYAMRMQPGPRYPPAALFDKREGFVVMEFDLTADGIPVEINIIESYPEYFFDLESIRSLSRSRYELKSGQEPGSMECFSIRFDYFLEEGLTQIELK